MVLPSGKPVHARHRDGAGGRHDPRQAARGRNLGHAGRRLTAALLARLSCIGCLVWLLAALPSRADTLRIATWNAGLERDGPGLLLRDIAAGRDPQVAAAVRVIVALDADVLFLTGVDYDAGHAALAELQRRMADAGAPYPHRFALAPNTGVATGFDVDGDGRLGPRDAQGWGRFAGAGGMALLSRLPVDAVAATDHSALLWADLPGALVPATDAPALRDVQRLSTTGHWVVPVILPEGGRLALGLWAATPPVFDGPEDRNGRRNHDEAAFWLSLLDSPEDAALPAPFVLMGDAQLDPEDSNGRAGAMRALLSHPALQDPRPRATHGRAEPDQRGDPALDTVLYEFGGLRTAYVLPSAGLRVAGAGVLWPAPDDPLAAVLALASRHRPVWVDIVSPPR
jgi:hypothetical protein